MPPGFTMRNHGANAADRLGLHRACGSCDPAGPGPCVSRSGMSLRNLWCTNAMRDRDPWRHVSLKVAS